MRTAMLALLAGILVLAGCAGLAKPELPPAARLDTRPSADQLAAALPPVPETREASGTAIWQVDGKDTFDRSLNAVENQQALDLISGSNSLSWGIWQFSLWLETAENVEIVADIAEGEHIYFALANFSIQSWDISGPYTAGRIVALDDALHHSPDGLVYVAAITYGGNQATVHRLIFSADDGWVVVTADSSPQVGWDTSLAIVDGKPAISYHDFGNHALKYASSSTTLGSSSLDWSAVTVDSDGVMGRYSSLAVVAGQPAISYHDGTKLALKYARRNDLSGDTWDIVMVNDTDPGATGTYTSLVVAGGRPLITYYDSSFDILLYSESSTATGTSEADWQNYWWDSVPDAGRYSSAAIVDGEVGCSYYDGTDHNLRYMWRTEPFKITVASAGLVGTHCSLAVIDDKPAISYYDSSNADLRYAFSSTARGTSASDWQDIIIDSGGEVGEYTSLAPINGRPAISYYDAGSTSLKFAWASTATGSSASDWRTTTVDRSGNTGTSASLAEVAGHPAISYYDADAQQLKYAIYLGP